jgi:hypothetical protein
VHDLARLKKPVQDLPLGNETRPVDIIVGVGTGVLGAPDEGAALLIGDPAVPVRVTRPSTLTCLKAVGVAWLKAVGVAWLKLAANRVTLLKLPHIQFYLVPLSVKPVSAALSTARDRSIYAGMATSIMPVAV